MSLNIARWSLFGCVLVSIAGCGGSSSGGGTGGGGGNGGGPQGDTTVTVTFLNESPTIAAVQIGAGSYAARTVTGGKLTVTIPAGTTTYSVAYVCPTPVQSGGLAAQTEGFQFASVMDGAAISISCPKQTPTPPTGTLTGTVDASAFPAAAAMNIVPFSSNYAGYVAVSPAGGAFQVDGPAGTDRVLVGLYDSTQINLSANLIAIKSYDNQAVPGALNGGAPVVFTAADATTPQQVTFANVPAGVGTPMMWGLSVNNSIPITAGHLAQYPQLPAGVLKSGEYYSIGAEIAQVTNGVTQVTGAWAYPTGGPVTLTFPSPWQASAPAAASRPTFNFNYTGFAGRANVSANGGISWFENSVSGFVITVAASGNYLTGGSSIQIPDLKAVGGFFSLPASGTLVSWNEVVSQSSYAPQATPAGGTASTVIVQGSYIAP